jgi:hypothetical protein
MQNHVDMFISYVYRTGRKKENRGDAFVGLLVQEGYEIPDGLTRSMITELRKYLANQHQVKPDRITIQNVVRLNPEVTSVPSENDSGVQRGGVPEGVEEIPRVPGTDLDAEITRRSGVEYGEDNGTVVAFAGSVGENPGDGSDGLPLPPEVAADARGEE